MTSLVHAITEFYILTKKMNIYIKATLLAMNIAEV